MKKLITLLLLTLSLTSWAAVGDVFTMGDLKYRILTEASSSTSGTVACIDLTEAATAKSSLNVDIPSTVMNYTVTSIEERAFMNCTGIKTLTIPETVTKIGDGFAAWCSSLFNIQVHPSNPNYSSNGTMLFDKKQTILYLVVDGLVNSAIKNIPSTVETIWSRAFNHVVNLEEVEIPYGVKSIGSYAFSHCPKLNRVVIPSSVETLGLYCFYNSPSLSDLFINTTTPITINKSTMFLDAGNPNLYIPEGYTTTQSYEQAYKAAGWTGFKSYNKDDMTAYDKYYNGLCYSVTKIATTIIDGKSYDGTCKIVRGDERYKDVSGTVNVPDYVEVNFANGLAVTNISPHAFGTSKSYNVTGCGLVDEVEYRSFYKTPITSITLPRVSAIYDEAFYECTSLISCQWGNRLKAVYSDVFNGAPLAHDIILPVGFEKLGSSAFANVKSKRMLIPSTLNWAINKCINTMKSLEELIINTDYLCEEALKPIDIPKNCKILVPVGCKAQYQAAWPEFTNIQKGSYDFSYKASFTSPYTMTVTSNKPVTLNGVTYDGTAKYGYNSRIVDMTSYAVANYETDKMCGGERRYLMTEIGDSCLYGSNVTSIDFAKMKGLYRIGKAAFSNSKLESAKFDNYMSFGNSSFFNVPSLTEIVVSNQGCEWDGGFYGNNHSNFRFYVPNEHLNTYLESNLKNYGYDSNLNTCDKRVSPYIIPTADTYPLGTIVPLDLYSQINAMKVYALLDAPDANGVFHARRYGDRQYLENIESGLGLILTDLEPGKLYKLPRILNYNRYNQHRYLYPVKVRTDIYSLIDDYDDFYYWDTASKKFVMPTKTHYINGGQCYLYIDDYYFKGKDLYIDIFPPASTGATGDVNGDGNIDIADVNVVINVMLGKASAASYPGADVNKDGTVDIADVNKILNTMLGK